MNQLRGRYLIRKESKSNYLFESIDNNFTMVTSAAFEEMAREMLPEYPDGSKNLAYFVKQVVSPNYLKNQN